MANNDNGLASLNAAFDRVLAAAKEAALAAILKDANELAAAQRSLAERSRQSGELIESITVTPPGGTTPSLQSGGSRLSGPNQVIVTAGDDDAWYARYVEFGTSHSDPAAFFYPAYRLLTLRFKRRDKSAVSRAVKKAWRQQ